MSKEFGNRRSEEELKRVTDELNALSYQLEEQSDFKGTPEQLKMMQAAERRYIDGYPIMSDEEWDTLKRQWNYHESLTSVAPSGRTWVRLQSPLPSMEKASTLNEIRDFLSKWPKGTEFLYELKLDGLTANLVYSKTTDSNGEVQYMLEHITSRGNGRYGLKLWDGALLGVKLRGVPQCIHWKYVALVCNGELPERFETRGEALIEKNEQSVSRYMPQFEPGQELVKGLEPIVWRSVVSGIFNRKVPQNIPGLCQYLYGKTFHELWKDAKYHAEVGEDAIEITEIADARLFASLTQDEERFGRQDRLWVLGDGRTLFVQHAATGNSYCETTYEEAVTVVSYSASVNGVNLDTDMLRHVEGLVYVDQVKYASNLEMAERHEYNDLTPFCGCTSDAEEIVKMARIFYGVDESGKRDQSMPRYRNMHQFSIDGIVVKLKNSTEETQGLTVRNSKSNRSKLVIPKYPLDAIALKLQSEVTVVKLARIERNETDLKNVTIQGVLDKAYQTESGAWVERINLHNPHWLELNNYIHEGGVYRMVLAMDIIPVLLPPDDWSPEEDQNLR